MTSNSYNYNDQLKELEDIFERALNRWKRLGGDSSDEICTLRMKNCGQYVSGDGGYYDKDALREFAKKLREHGYYTYWGKPSHMYDSMQYLTVYAARQIDNCNRVEII